MSRVRRVWADLTGSARRSALVAVAALAALSLIGYIYVARDVRTETVTGPLRVSLALPNEPVAAGEAIPLTVTLRNTGDVTLIVVRPSIVPNLVFLEVTGEDGEVLFYGPYLKLTALDRHHFVDLAPGENVKHEFDLAAWYQLPAGDYTVVATYENVQDGSHLGLSAVVVHEVRSAPVSMRIR